MDWIKTHFEKFSLLLLSVALLGASVYLIYSARGFVATFANVNATPPVNNSPIPLDTKSLDTAQASLEKPAAWTTSDKEGFLFSSRGYFLSPDGKSLVDPIVSGTMIHPPVPNQWIIDHGLDIRDPNILEEDSNGNGFTNRQKYDAHCDPTDKNSHPPYTSVLFLEQYIQVPFRLRFMARPDDTSFQIETVDVHQPTQILQMGDTIAGTKYKIVDFKEKHMTDESGIDHDVSELTVQQTETGEKVVLIMGKVVNSPDSYAKFKYTWLTAPSEFTVKLHGEFNLKPETDIHYKLIDIDAKGATIENLKTNEQIKIPLLPQGTTH